MRVAIIGPIGSGKTTVLNQFSQRGFKTIEADQIVLDLYKKGKAGYKAILASEHFGAKFITPKEVNKEALRNALKENPNLKLELEALIHPLINKFISKYSNIVCEIPILGSSKTKFNFDLVIYVKANRDTCIDRLVNLRGMERALAEMIYDWFSIGDVKVDVEIDTSPGEGVYEDNIDDIIEKYSLNDYELD